MKSVLALILPNIGFERTSPSTEHRSEATAVADALFVSRLREALDLLGMDLALTVTASGGAELTISLGDESEVYRVPPHESPPLYALLIYAREVFSEAGLMPPIASPDDGRGIDLRLGRV